VSNTHHPQDILQSISDPLIATGGIARTFTKDLLIDPTTRGTKDILHQVTAVASSSSIDSAQNFISEIVTPKQAEPPCSAYGSYSDLVQDPKVDMIYVATPHSHHYQNVMLCLTASKPVLCEKAFTVNASQAQILYNTAQQKNLFLMEAVWTRFFPLSLAIRQHITNGDLGQVLRVSADLSIGQPPEHHFPTTNRMINPHLAGGCLLDLGIYSLTWIFQTLYHTLPSSPQRQPPSVKGVIMTPEPRTGTDEMTTILLDFPQSPPSGGSEQTHAHAIATTALRVDYDPDKLGSAGPAIRIQGTKAEIQVFGPAFRPERYRFIPCRSSTSSGEKDENDDDKKKEGSSPSRDHAFDFPGGGHGMFWEADEAARCWRDGARESEGMPWEESILIMKVMDEVRRLGGLKYPEEIESKEFPLRLGGKS
jgi:predicted dehydrogenase